jgi:hypothetical protein
MPASIPINHGGIFLGGVRQVAGHLLRGDRHSRWWHDYQRQRALRRLQRRLQARQVTHRPGGLFRGADHRRQAGWRRRLHAGDLRPSIANRRRWSGRLRLRPGGRSGVVRRYGPVSERDLGARCPGPHEFQDLGPGRSEAPKTDPRPIQPSVLTQRYGGGSEAPRLSRGLFVRGPHAAAGLVLFAGAFMVDSVVPI